MPAFDNCLVALEVKDLHIGEKKKLKAAITDNGGSIAFVINKKCTHVVVSNLDSVSSNRLKSIRRFQVPVVGVEYVSQCLEQGRLLVVEGYSPALPHPRDPPRTPKLTGQQPREQPKDLPEQNEEEKAEEGPTLGHFRVYGENEKGLPTYPEDFQVAKYSVFDKGDGVAVVELQCCAGNPELPFRVARREGERCSSQVLKTRGDLIFTATSEAALQAYELVTRELTARGFRELQDPIGEARFLGSEKLQELLLEESLNSSTIPREVGEFVELLWTEALGCLGDVLATPVSAISPGDVSRAEGALLQVHKALSAGAGHSELAALMAEFYRALPHKDPARPTPTAKILSQKRDLCQLIRDIVSVSEATLWSSTPSSLAKYRALRCSMEQVHPGSAEFSAVEKLLHDSSRPVQIKKALRVCRAAELQSFRRQLGNVRPLLHASAPGSFVGILSRGLLLPKTGVEQHGIERTDAGTLGSGIYFSDAVSTSMKYSKPSAADGTRVLAVCDVALGQCKELVKRDFRLVSAPEGYHSVHGVRRTPRGPSDFEDDEYVVYDTNQVQLKYVVQFSACDDQVKEFEPSVDVSAQQLEQLEQPLTFDTVSEREADGPGEYRDPLREVTVGLQDSAGRPLLLQRVHVKGKVMDLLAQVVVFQTYTNHSAVPIEAKYVFPLDESAAVCGFEAFINGKHVVGEVKEKEQARREYREAIEKGHGAYLMDQEAPDVFTISVGNLPPESTVLIKITYVAELTVSHGDITFRLPGSVAPWQQSHALTQRTQDTVGKVAVNEVESERCFALDMSVEMPYEITDIRSVTHQIEIKKTQCKAVISTEGGSSLGADGFLLSITLAEMHLPRMWVENHPEKDSQACMLVFYPEFESSGEVGAGEVVIVLDSSNSMRGSALQDARKIALLVLKALSCKVNVLFFGTDYKELFLCSQDCKSSFEAAKKFIMTNPPAGGGTELWRPLRTFSLLAPSRGVRNLLLISDGHVQNEGLTLQLARENVPHTRVFTCGVGSAANRHMLRSLARAGGGAHEFFDAKTKHTWQEKVTAQVKRMASPGCSSVSVKWQQFRSRAPPPVQAPAQLLSLFSDCRLLVYGFVPHCTRATLTGKVSDREIETTVATTELQKTKGTLLHTLAARAVIRDYEEGSLHAEESEHEARKAELKSYIIGLSKEYSVVTQFTSFVAIEERDEEKQEFGSTDIEELIAMEDVDCLPYLEWESRNQGSNQEYEEEDEEEMDREDHVLQSHSLSESENEEEDEEEMDREDHVLQSHSLSESHYECAEYTFLHMPLFEQSEAQLNVPYIKPTFSCVTSMAQSPSPPVAAPQCSTAGFLFSASSFHPPAAPTGPFGAGAAPTGPFGAGAAPTGPFGAGAAPTGLFGAGAAPRGLLGARPAPRGFLGSRPAPRGFLGAGAAPRGPFDAGAAPTGPFDAGAAPTGPFDAGAAPTGPFGAGAAPTGPFRTGAAPTGLFGTGAAPTGLFGTGAAPTGLFRTGAAPTGLFGAGAAPTGLFGAGAAPTGPFGAGAAPTGLFGAGAAPRGLLGARPAPRGFLGSRPAPRGFLGAGAAPRGPFDAGAAPTGLFGAGAAPTGPFGAGAAPTGPFRTGAAPTGPFRTGAAPTGLFGTGAAPTGLFRAGAAPTGLFGAGAAPTGPFGAGAAPRGPFGAGAAPTGPFGAGAAPNGFFGTGAANTGLFGTRPAPTGLFGTGAAPTGLFGTREVQTAETLSCQPLGIGEASLVLSGENYGDTPVPVLGALGSVLPDWGTPHSFPSPQPQLDLPDSYQAGGGFRTFSRASDKDRRSGDAVALRSFPTHSPVTVDSAPHLGPLQDPAPSRLISQDALFSHEGVPLPPSLSPPCSPDLMTAAESPRPAEGASWALGGGAGISARRVKQKAAVPSARLRLQEVGFAAHAQQEMEERGKRKPSAGAVVCRETREELPSGSLRSQSCVLSWNQLFALQHKDGYWPCTAELGSLLGVDLDFLANIFLKEKGILSLGLKAREEILQLLATLLVLQLLRFTGQTEGIQLTSLFQLEDTKQPRPARWGDVSRAVAWARAAERRHPCACSRLELGRGWESVTRRLLRLEPLERRSPLRPVLNRA